MKTVVRKNRQKTYSQNLHFIDTSKKRIKPSDIISLFGKIEFIENYDYKKERTRKK